MADATNTTERLAQVFAKFQKAAASKAILEEQANRLEAEVSVLDAELSAGLARLGYDPASGQTAEEYLGSVAAGIEHSLAEYEKAVL